MSVRLLTAALVLGASALAARADDDVNPYKNAKVGDYATYKMTTKVAGMDIIGSMTQTVIAKSDKELTTKTTGKISFMGNDIDIPEKEEKVDITKPYDPTSIGGAVPPGTDAKAELGKEGKEKIQVGGKEYDATWTTYKVKTKAMGQDVKSELKVWMARKCRWALSR